MKAVGARVLVSGQMRGIRAGFLEEAVPNSHLEEGLNDSQATKDKAGMWGRGNRQEREQRLWSTLKEAMGLGSIQ